MLVRVTSVSFPLTRLFLFLLIVLVAVRAEAQTLPQDLGYSSRVETLLDAGLLWNINSNFHPLNINNLINNDSLTGHTDAFGWMLDYVNTYSNGISNMNRRRKDGLSLSLIPGIGLSAQAGPDRCYDLLAGQPFLRAEAYFKANWYARLYVRATNVSESLPHYTGITRSIDRAGLNTGEIDQSVVGFRNDWVNLEFGRGREIWGPLTEDNLLLAGNSPAWEKLMLHLTYKRFSYRWFFGYLETIFDQGNIQRYTVGRAIEYRNKRNIVLSVGEVSILSGLNRPVDIAFLNPFAVHLEIEQNRRDNETEDNYANSIWFANIDWLARPDIRLIGSFALDELQIDKQSRKKFQTGALGYLGRVAWRVTEAPVGIILFGYGVRLDTYTMQHVFGYSNNVTRNNVIGHPIGNDADDIAVGLKCVLNRPVALEIKFGRRRWGDGSLLENPYMGYEPGFPKTNFPSGEVRTNRYIAYKIDTTIHKHIFFVTDGHLDLSHQGINSGLEAVTFSIRYQKMLSLSNL